VAFVSNATDITAGDTKDVSNIYLHDLQTSTTSLVSRGVDGAASDGASTRPVLAGSGRFVVFESEASNLVCGKRCGPPDRDINLLTDVFVFDRDAPSIVRLSSDPDSEWMEPSGSAALDASGRIIAFSSRHPIAADDTHNDFDLFVATRCGDSKTVQP
jgi:Tol biopolymer transport system component